MKIAIVIGSKGIRGIVERVIAATRFTCSEGKRPVKVPAKIPANRARI